MDSFGAVEKRYSYNRRFFPDGVPLKDLELIAKTGLIVPVR
jgi:hypothetical protein